MILLLDNAYRMFTLEQGRILRNNCKFAPQLFKSDCRDIHPIDLNFPALCFQKSEKGGRNGTLPSTRSSNHSHLCPRLHFKSNYTNDSRQIRSIPQSQVFNFDTSALWPVLWRFMAWWRVTGCFRLNLQVMSDTLHRIHVHLVRRVETDDPEDVVSECDGIG